ncbi:AIPR family protein [Marinomonas sp. BSi20584]|uniref:AIPR family protein n=1 Tax=Marinomonas sp. BSi20584 TaxID=1594462 RepID=UPI000C1F5DF6|nr:AIPR family protein [Marinomonas sp. BSi20584]PJE55526.1 hypothetical protein TY87_10460 [Marinomonas sp. BSi20584]
MKNIDFYDILDGELSKISEGYSVALNKKFKQDQQKKSYAFLIWFLNFYSGISNIEGYITDGSGDNSCDIILDKKNSQGDTIFYLVQSKWNTKKNCDKDFESEVLKSYLSDVQSILRGEKEKTENDRFNSRYDDLLSHIKSNGEVKVLYLTLKNSCGIADNNIKSFEKLFGGKVSVDSFDINRIKLDYIDFNFKKSFPPNPLEKIYNPEYEKIKLNIVSDDERNFLKINKPFEAHVFNIVPKTIFDLVERYGVSLFDKNVRNPLVSSSINKEIINSLRNDPSYFWYYNNGITAISRFIPPIGSQAQNFEVTGLQIINGAQTAYSIYTAYLEASPDERKIIDAEARVTLRLLKSGGKDFDLKVTKFTNSQNPVSERDFWSSDSVQIKIQNYFYSTDYWYEKRSGEFRKTPKGIFKVPNNIVASAHLAFYLSKPVLVFSAALNRENTGEDLIFVSHKENPDGLYETIFNKETKEVDVFASFCMLDILTDSSSFELDSIHFTNGFHILSMSKVILEKYLKEKFGNEVNLSNYIVKSFNEDNKKVIKQCFVYASNIMSTEVESGNENEEEEAEKAINLITKNAHFEMLLETLNKSTITIDDIERLSTKKENKIDFDDDDMAIIEDNLVH